MSDVFGNVEIDKVNFAHLSAHDLHDLTFYFSDNDYITEEVRKEWLSKRTDKPAWYLCIRFVFRNENAENQKQWDQLIGFLDEFDDNSIGVYKIEPGRTTETTYKEEFSAQRVERLKLFRNINKEIEKLEKLKVNTRALKDAFFDALKQDFPEEIEHTEVISVRFDDAFIEIRCTPDSKFYQHLKTQGILKNLPDWYQNKFAEFL